MQCHEVKEHLHAYADGELTPALHDAVARSLEGCPECQDELSEIMAIHSLAREAFTSPVEEVDFSGFADGVMARIATENAIDGVKVERREVEPGLFARMSKWLGELVTFERPMAAFASVALVVALVTALYVIGKERGATPEAPGGKPQIASNDGKKATPVAPKVEVAKDDLRKRRRGPEREHFDRRNAAVLESHRVAGGRIFIERDEASDRPAVVWHVDSETVEAVHPMEPRDDSKAPDVVPN